MSDAVATGTAAGEGQATTAAAPASAYAYANRTARCYRIAELIVRFRAEPHGDRWRVFDAELGVALAADYPEEATARAGARLQAAVAIDELFDALDREGR